MYLFFAGLTIDFNLPLPSFGPQIGFRIYYLKDTDNTGDVICIHGLKERINGGPKPPGAVVLFLELSGFQIIFDAIHPDTRPFAGIGRIVAVFPF
jgi:hypothetical protein